MNFKIILSRSVFFGQRKALQLNYRISQLDLVQSVLSFFPFSLPVCLFSLNSFIWITAITSQCSLRFKSHLTLINPQTVQPVMIFHVLTLSCCVLDKTQPQQSLQSSHKACIFLLASTFASMHIQPLLHQAASHFPVFRQSVFNNHNALFSAQTWHTPTYPLRLSLCATFSRHLPPYHMHILRGPSTSPPGSLYMPLSKILSSTVLQMLVYFCPRTNKQVLLGQDQYYHLYIISA